jgi:hypothetical protein
MHLSPTPQHVLPCPAPPDLQTLLPNITGAFDNLLAVSGWSVGKMLPVLIAGYDWEGSYLDADMQVLLQQQLLPSGLSRCCCCCCRCCRCCRRRRRRRCLPGADRPTPWLIPIGKPPSCVCGRKGGRADPARGS